MDKQDLISIIIPVYNVEKYLRTCLESVLDQTYKNYEVLLIDDGSTDSSVSICEEFCKNDDRFKLFQKENGGASSARNVGLKNAQGKYIYFLDSDDCLYKNTLEKLYNCAIIEKADLVFCEAVAFDDDTGAESLTNYSYHKQYEPGSPNKIFKEMLEYKEFHVAVWLFMVERDLIENNSLYFKEGIIYEDMIFAYQLFCIANHAAHVHEVLYSRRYRANSVMTTAKSEKNFKSAIEVYNSVVAFSDTLDNEKKSNEYQCKCAYNALNDYRALSKENKLKYKDNFKLLKQDIKQHNYFDDKALKMRCYGYYCWLVYKIIQKPFRIFGKGK